LIIFIAVVFVNIGTIIDNNKDYLLTQAEKSLGRKVALGKIDVKLWGGLGVRVSDFSLADDPVFSSKNFIQTDGLLINLKLLPLLRKEVEITEFILDKPAIEIIRDKKGQLNFSGLGRSSEPTDKSTAQPLRVARLQIKGGDVHFVDQQNGKDLRVSHVDLAVNDFDFEKPFTLNLALALLGDRQNVSLQSRIGPLGALNDPMQIPLEAAINLDSLPMDKLMDSFPLLADYIPSDVGFSSPLTAKLNVSKKGNEVSITQIDMKTGIFASNKPNLSFKGNVQLDAGNFQNVTLNGDLGLNAIPLKKLETFSLIKESIPQNLSMDGNSNLTAHIEGNPNNLLIKAELEAAGGAFRFGDQFDKAIGIPLRLKTESRITPKTITLETLELNLSKLQMKGKGEIGRGKTTSLDLTLDSNPADLSDLKSILPLLKEYDPAGKLEFHLRLQQKTDTPQIVGTIQLDQVKAKHASLPQPITAGNGKIEFKGNQAETKDFTFQLGDSKIALLANAAKLVPLDLTYQLDSEQLDLANINESLKSTSAKPNLVKTINSNGHVRMDKEAMAARGKITALQGTFKNLDFTDLKGDIDFAKNVLVIENLSLNSLDGVITGKITYDLHPQPPTFDIAMQTQKLDVAEYFRANIVSLPKSIEGRINLDLNLAGSGSGWDSIKPTLQGQGKAQILDGVIIDTNLAEGVLAGMSGLPGLTNFLTPTLKEKYPRIFGSKDTLFEQLTAAISIKDGKINLSNLLVAAADWAVGAKGTLDFDQLLNADGTLQLSKNFTSILTSQVKILQALVNEQGQAVIPFTLSGTLPGVKPVPNASFLTQSLQNALLKQGAQQLQQRGLPNLLPILNQPSQETQQTAPADADSAIPAASQADPRSKSPLDLLPKLVTPEKETPISATAANASATSATSTAKPEIKSPLDLLPKALDKMLKK
jgi:uncharacterized protein involved in outer membrane biogenesis